MSQGAQDLQTQLRTLLTNMQKAPSPYESEAYRAQLAASEAELAAQYGAERSRLEEQLARQGLSASTFGAGRYGDLAGQQARAQAGMRAELLKEAANQQAQQQQVLLQGLTALSGQMSQQEIATFNANLDRYKASTQFQLDARQLQQNAALQGVQLSIQQAANLAENQYRTESLKNQIAEITSREKITGRQISSTLLAALIPQLDLSSLTQEQLQSLFREFGLTLPNVSVRETGTGTGTGTGTSTGTNTGTDESVPEMFMMPPDLRQYEGKIINVNGVRYRIQNGVAFNVVTGLPYAG